MRILAIAWLAFLAQQPAVPSSTPAIAPETPTNAPCQLFIYPVNANGRVASSPIITPNQVASVVRGVDPLNGVKNWTITLTSEGAKTNLAYT